LSSGLLKGNWVQFQIDDARVIDSNDLLKKRLSSSEQVMSSPEDKAGDGESGETGFQSGLAVEELDGVTVGEDGPAVIKASLPEPIYDGPSPEELIEQAKEEIRQMKEAAREEIEAARRQAIDEGRDVGKREGYQEGAAAAAAELEEERRKLEKSYEEAYNEKVSALEPALVKELTGIYEHVFHVGLGEYQGLVMQLLKGCLQKMKGSGSYIVHVSPEDYPYVSMQKKQLVEEMSGKNAMLEVVEDAMVVKNACMIEADSGIYDCSLDVQLAALRRELLLLSYEGVDTE